MNRRTLSKMPKKHVKIRRTWFGSAFWFDQLVPLSNTAPNISHWLVTVLRLAVLYQFVFVSKGLVAVFTAHLALFHVPQAVFVQTTGRFEHFLALVTFKHFVRWFPAHYR